MPQPRVIYVRSIGSWPRDRWAAGYRWASSQPGWVVRVALLAFLLVLAVPVMLLLMLAVLAAVLVGGGLLLANAVVNGVRRLFTGDGRENVRIIERKSDQA